MQKVSDRFKKQNISFEKFNHSAFEIKIKKMFLKDYIAVISIMIILWLVLAFVMVQVTSIVQDHMTKTIIILAGAVAGVFATASSIAVLAHLKKNKTALYSEELRFF